MIVAPNASKVVPCTSAPVTVVILTVSNVHNTLLTADVESTPIATTDDIAVKPALDMFTDQTPPEDVVVAPTHTFGAGITPDEP